MYNNVIKQKLSRDEVVYGLFCNIPSPMVVEILGYSGFDFVIIDAEHGISDLETVENMIRASEVSGTIPITRIGLNLQQHILRFLDAGSMGVQIPLINTKQEAQSVIMSVKYPPIGNRGLAPTRAANFGLDGSLSDYVKSANQETLVVVQIETMEAVQNLDDILSVENVDVVFFGPTDLSASLGVPGEIDHPKVVNVIEEAGKKVRGAGKSAGVLGRNPKSCLDWKAKGFRYLCANASSLLSQSATKFIYDINKTF